MQKRDVEFCNFREIRAVIVTWNAGASTPGSVRTSDFIRDAVHPEDPPDIIVFGFQELVDLENKKITASKFRPEHSVDCILAHSVYRESVAWEQEEGSWREGTHESTVSRLD